MFNIPTKYHLSKVLGRGSYGIVCSGINTETGEQVAIKKVNRIFRDKTETKRLLREIRLLKFFDNESIIQIKDILNPVRECSLDEFYIVTDLMASNLQ